MMMILDLGTMSMLLTIKNMWQHMVQGEVSKIVETYCF